MNDSVAEPMHTVRELVDAVRGGETTAAQFAAGCFAVIDATDAAIGAWRYVDRDGVMSAAERLDEIRRRGLPLGDLHGVPVGIKDIFDTADMPTECGSGIYAGRQPEADCAVVERLREAGAVILGKTTTTEFAWRHPTTTCNPHNPAYSPGGSSSGSAAAVAAGHVPLAIGSQTNGSTIRPASYCGVFGFKPSRGIVSRRGVFQTSETLDQVGMFGRDLGDVALLADALAGYDAQDPHCYLAPRPKMLQGYLAEVPVEPNFAWLEMPYNDRYSAAARQGCDELLDALEGQVDRIPAPKSFSALIDCHKRIYDYEISRCLRTEFTEHNDQLSATAREALEAALQCSDEQYREALGLLAGAQEWFTQFFYDYDAIITPSATGEAPLIADGTGAPICSTIWTLCGLPCLSMPLITGNEGLPIGVQLVANCNEDDRLLRTSRWLLEQLR